MTTDRHRVAHDKDGYLFHQDKKRKLNKGQSLRQIYILSTLLTRRLDYIYTSQAQMKKLVLTACKLMLVWYKLWSQCRLGLCLPAKSDGHFRKVHIRLWSSSSAWVLLPSFKIIDRSSLVQELLFWVFWGLGMNFWTPFFWTVFVWKFEMWLIHTINVFWKKTTRRGIFFHIKYGLDWELQKITR